MIDPATLLCERCGYVIEGLDESGNCPECGTPVAASLPERRPGSAWQTDHTARSMFRTAIRVLRAPRSAFEAISFTEREIGASSSTSLRRWLCFVAAFLLMLPWAALAMSVLLSGRPEDAPHPDVLFWMMFPAGTLYCAAIWGLLLSWSFLLAGAIADPCLRAFCAVRAWRFSPRVLNAVTAHAAAGFVAAALPVSLATSVCLIAPAAVFGYAPRPLALSLTLTGIATGFAVTTALSLMGLHTCRFANLARREHTPQPPAGTPA